MSIAASYIRTGVPGEPTDVQQILIKMFAKANDLTLRDNLWFIDYGVSGFTAFLSRPGGKNLVKAITDTPFDCVIVADIGHAFRNTFDAELTTNYLQSRGITLLSAFDKPKVSCRNDCLQENIDRYLEEFYDEREEKARRMIDGV